MKNKLLIQIAVISILTLSFVSCYDLAELNVNPYDPTVVMDGGGIVEPGDSTEFPIDTISKYADINIDYYVSQEDSLNLKKEQSTVGAIFKNFLYEGYYNDYQVTTNLTHDIYAGYVANNQSRFVGSSPDYDYSDGWSSKRWTHFYSHRSTEYKKLLRIFKFTEPEKYKNAFYITRIYYAFLALANTDTYGDMPFSVYVRARDPQEGNVPYDTQEKVYDIMFRMLEQAVDSINLADASQFSFGDDDRCYFGDAEKWIRFANTLRLRMALRISNVDPERARIEGEAALQNPYGLILNNDDNMQTVPKHAPVSIGGDDIGGNENPLAMISIAYNGETVLSKDMELFYRNLSVGGGSYMVGSDQKTIDPRCLVCWWRPTPMNGIKSGKENTKNDFTGCERGNPDVDQNSGEYSLTRTLITGNASKELNPKYWFSYSRPTVWLGYSESLFLKAEAALRGWSGANEMSVEQYFKAGIQASLDYYEIDAAEADSYISGLKIYQPGETNPFSGSDKEAILEQIITHKWMAVFPNGNEGWAEFRRTDYPNLMNQLKNNSGGSVPKGKNIKRIYYPYSEELNKTETKPSTEYNTQGTRLWWDVADTNDANGNRVRPNNFRTGINKMLKF